MNPPRYGGCHMKFTRLFSGRSKAWITVTAGCLTMLAQAAAQTPPVAAQGTVAPPLAVAAPTASPAATAEPADSPAERGRVLYPANGPQPSPATARGGEAGGMPGLTASFLMLLALCGGGYYLVRRQTGFAPVGKGQRKLIVSESRSLGNRQFLVVVEYENERVLLGVAPGKIDYLCPLPTANALSETVSKERVT